MPSTVIIRSPACIEAAQILLALTVTGEQWLRLCIDLFLSTMVSRMCSAQKLHQAKSTEARASPGIQNACHIRCRKKRWKLKCSIRLRRQLRKSILQQRSLAPAVDAEVYKGSISHKCHSDLWICIFMDTVLVTQQ
ncbi:uncharacterized protein LOC125046853 [Penaeus chinensis]|uniref:uncharacterized protein LOC125046853 n=1 Tax=Penaeus chinensis TaxID=139456 RepID=UPI001FB639D3|nr:uncharacterized protein LOC125046853 [Penaeus chinensis]